MCAKVGKSLIMLHIQETILNGNLAGQMSQRHRYFRE